MGDSVRPPDKRTPVRCYRILAKRGATRDQESQGADSVRVWRAPGRRQRNVTAGGIAAGRCALPRLASDRLLAGAGLVRGKNREHDQWGADTLGSVAGADTLAVRIGSSAAIGCSYRLHESPQSSSVAERGSPDRVRRHIDKSLFSKCLSSRRRALCRECEFDSKAIVSTGQFASVMTR